jgi:hypothetical protein
MSRKLNLDRKKLMEFMKENYNDNFSSFARDLDLDTSHLYKFLTKGTGGGLKIYTAIMALCNAKGLNFNEYLMQ